MPFLDKCEPLVFLLFFNKKLRRESRRGKIYTPKSVDSLEASLTGPWATFFTINPIYCRYVTYYRAVNQRASQRSQQSRKNSLGHRKTTSCVRNSGSLAFARRQKRRRSKVRKNVPTQRTYRNFSMKILFNLTLASLFRF